MMAGSMFANGAVKAKVDTNDKTNAEHGQKRIIV
jgi:hypothetical protein